MSVSPVSYSKTPQAKDDYYAFTEDEVDALGVLALDVMSNDLGGKAKTLYSLADGTVTSDLLDQDAKANAPDDDTSLLGAPIWLGTDGKIHYDAKAISGVIDALAAGETLTDTFSYAIRMGNGTISIATVTITFTGDNDAPDLYLADGDSASAVVGEDDAPLQAGGTIHLVDPDTTDVVDLAVTATATGTIVGVPDFAGMFSLSQIDNLAANSASPDAIAWTFDASGADFNYLAVGESVVITYTITATDWSSDGLVARGGSDTQTVTVTIEGRNDGPVISGGDTSAMLAEDGSVSATGSLAFSDVDLSDAHVVGVSPGGAGYLGTFSATLADASTGDGTGSIDWSFSVDNAALQYLGANDTLVQTYSVEIDDGNGGTASQLVTVTIEGTNDLPEITGALAVLAGGTEDTGYPISAADLLQGWSDVDQGTALAVSNLSVDHGTIAPDGMGGWVFTPDANYHGPVVLSYDVVDGDGGVVPATLSFDLAPVNDAATVADGVGAVYEDGVGTASGTIVVTDVDGAAEEGVMPATLDGKYGQLVLQANGSWTYTLNPGDPDLDMLDAGESYVENFELTTIDGTAFAIDVTVHGADEAPTVVTPPNTHAGTGDPNDFDTLTGGAANNSATISGGNSSNDTITGGSAAQNIDGRGGNDTIYGGGGGDSITGNNGNDTLYGQAGDDRISGNNGDDVAYGGSGSDDIVGGNDADALYGGSGNDILDGSGGNDIVIGGYGADTLTGGEGDDTFRMLSLLDTNDLITDFGVGNDVIDFSALDAVGGGSDDAFAFGGTSATANGVWYVQDGANTVIYADTDGNTATAEFMVTLQNYDSDANALTAAMFVL